MRAKIFSVVFAFLAFACTIQSATAGWPLCGWHHGHRARFGYYSSWRSCFPVYSTYVYRAPVCYPVAPCPPSPCYFYPNYDWCGPYGIYYNPQSNFVQYNLPPIIAPAELSYGPQAVKRFMGLDPQLGLGPLAAPNPPAAVAPAQVQPQAAPATQPAARVREVKFSNARSRDVAKQFLDFGDTLFQQQRFQEALQRYRTAAINAADVPEVFFRQGHAYVAVNQFDLAARAFKRALQLRADADRENFKLDDIYADNRIAKSTHLETLAQRALSNPNDADAFFLIGVFLHYDGQAERAAKFFRQAENLAGGDDQHLRPFLPEIDRVAAN